MPKDQTGSELRPFIIAYICTCYSSLCISNSIYKSDINSALIDITELSFTLNDEKGSLQKHIHMFLT